MFHTVRYVTRQIIQLSFNGRCVPVVENYDSVLQVIVLIQIGEKIK